MRQYKGLNGESYTLLEKIGEGGEGRIFLIEGHPDLVAKLYLSKKFTKEEERLRNERKLRAMIARDVPPSPDGVVRVAWPRDILYDEGGMVGYVMPRVDTRCMIFQLCRDGSKYFPRYTWKYAVQFAYHLAWLVNYLHTYNIIIGDFNQNNIVVDLEHRTIVMIDCDSFDLVDENTGEHFPCAVGVHEVLAPEIQLTGDYSRAAFTKESDYFSLAIHIFRLLMNNCDPFAGVVIEGKSRSGLPINYDIINGNCPYVRNLEGIEIPRKAPRPEMLPPDVLALFTRTFSYTQFNVLEKITNRATAREWARTLKIYGKGEPNPYLKTCPVNKLHVYPAHNEECPWCEIEAIRSSSGSGGRSKRRGEEGFDSPDGGEIIDGGKNPRKGGVNYGPEDPYERRPREPQGKGAGASPRREGYPPGEGGNQPQRGAAPPREGTYQGSRPLPPGGGGRGKRYPGEEKGIRNQDRQEYTAGRGGNQGGNRGGHGGRDDRGAYVYVNQGGRGSRRGGSTGGRYPKEKRHTGLIVLFAFLLAALVGLSSILVYQRFLEKEDAQRVETSEPKKADQRKEETGEDEQAAEEEEVEEAEEKEPVEMEEAETEAEPTSEPTPEPTQTPRERVLLTPSNSVSSSILYEPGYSYDPVNLYDWDLSSAWVEGADGEGIGEYVDFFFPRGTILTGISIAPGLLKSEYLFLANSAPSVVTIQSGGQSTRIDLYRYANLNHFESCGYLDIPFDQPLECDGTVRLYISEVRPGSAYSDTCISELYYYGYPLQ